MNKVLVVATHPDDETLGCGGTLLKHKESGDEIYWLLCTKPQSSNLDRILEINKVSQLYQFKDVFTLDLMATLVDQTSTKSLVDKISEVFNIVKPNIVYLPFKDDIHSDHRAIFEAAFSCTKKFRYPFLEKVYMMETISETEFSISGFFPNVFVDISDFIEKKKEIMEIYSSEISEHPFPRSLKNIEALAVIRGATAGCNFAESFVLLKEIR